MIQEAIYNLGNSGHSPLVHIKQGCRLAFFQKLKENEIPKLKPFFSKTQGFCPKTHDKF